MLFSLFVAKRAQRPASHAHAVDGAGGVGRAQLLSTRLGGRQGRLGVFRDRLTLVFGATTLLSFLLL